MRKGLYSVDRRRIYEIGAAEEISRKVRDLFRPLLSGVAPSISQVAVVESFCDGDYNWTVLWLCAGHNWLLRPLGMAKSVIAGRLEERLQGDVCGSR